MFPAAFFAARHQPPSIARSRATRPDRMGEIARHNDCVNLLHKTLDEIRAADKKLTTAAEAKSIFALRDDPLDASLVETKRRAGSAGRRFAAPRSRAENVKSF